MTGFCWKMYREAIKQRADIYEFHHPDLIPAGLLLKLSGKKVIYNTREYFPGKILSMRWIPALLRPLVSVIFNFYQRMTSLAWDHVIVTDRHSATAFTGRPTSVVPKLPPARPCGADRVRHTRQAHAALCRRFVRRSRAPGYAQDCELLGAHNVELQLMGKFSFPEDEKLVRAAPNVQYLGSQNLRSVYQRVAEADLGLLLLQPVPAYIYAGENTLKLFEYMCGALPVVSSDFPN